jgi:hypothetical protein
MDSLRRAFNRGRERLRPIKKSANGPVQSTQGGAVDASISHQGLAAHSQTSSNPPVHARDSNASIAGLTEDIQQRIPETDIGRPHSGAERSEVTGVADTINGE